MDTRGITKKCKVLMVTGVYLPEINGAVLQCKKIISSLSNKVEFEILSGSVNRVICEDTLDCGVRIARISAGDSGVVLKFFFVLFFLIKFTAVVRRVEIVHVHGFSLRNSLLIVAARLFRKKVILKMTSFGKDDPLSVRQNSKILWQLYKMVNAFIAISPAFAKSAESTGLALGRCHLIPNSVDTQKFRPASISSRKSLRERLCVENDEKLLLFVGHFSTEKRPVMIYDAWRALVEEGYSCKLIMIGKTSSGFEIDSNLAQHIRADAKIRGLSQKLTILEFTETISDFMMAADVFVHPSVREGLPNVVLEAMASSLPCIVTRLPGVTDFLIRNGETGLLIEKDDLGGLIFCLKLLLRDQSLSDRLGTKARELVVSNYGCSRVSRETLNLYLQLTCL